MADVMPDYKVEQQKLAVQIMTLRTNLERNKLEIMQLDSRKEAALINMKASREAIEDCEKRLKGLEKTHGKPEELSE